MKRQKPQLVLPRREFLKMGGAGVLGTIIAASTLEVAGAQRPSVENVKANLHALKMGDFNPNYAAQWTYRLAQALGYRGPQARAAAVRGLLAEEHEIGRLLLERAGERLRGAEQV